MCSVSLTFSPYRTERDSIQEELDSTQGRARRMLLGMGERLVQASVEVALLHHRVRGLTTSLQGALSDGVRPPAYSVCMLLWATWLFCLHINTCFPVLLLVSHIAVGFWSSGAIN